MKILLEREEVNPDKADNDGWTPLMYATRRGHEGDRTAKASRSGSPRAARGGSLGNPKLVSRTRNHRRSYGSLAWVYWYPGETGQLAGEDVAELQQPEVVVHWFGKGATRERQEVAVGC